MKPHIPLHSACLPQIWLRFFNTILSFTTQNVSLLLWVFLFYKNFKISFNMFSFFGRKKEMKITCIKSILTENEAIIEIYSCVSIEK